MKKWIEIKDIKPKEPMLIIIGYWDKDKFLQDIIFYDGISGTYYTHWMPLPEPPD